MEYARLTTTGVVDLLRRLRSVAISLLDFQVGGTGQTALEILSKYAAGVAVLAVFSLVAAASALEAFIAPLWKAAAAVDYAHDSIVVQWLTLKLLGAIFFAANWSLRPQLLALAGDNGILPVSTTLRFVRKSLGTRSGVSRYPTLMWLPINHPRLFPSSDVLLSWLNDASLALSVLVVVGVGPLPVWFGLLTVFYLSLVVAAQDFLAFQWDSLLIEVGLIGALWSPMRLINLLPATATTANAAAAGAYAPSFLVMWIARFVLFKLMLSSGIVKFTSRCPNWRNLRAMNFHYYTTCLPHVGGYYLWQLPDWFHSLSVVANHVIECLVPWLIFGPWQARAIAFCAFTVLQVNIIASGNYGYFNWLTIVFSLPLLTDSMLATVLPSFLSTPLGLGAVDAVDGLAAVADPRGGGLVSDWWLPAVIIQVGCALALAVFYISVNCVPLILAFRRDLAGVSMPEGLVSLYSNLRPFRLVNSYGLFARMTTDRQECFVEGTRDGGETWERYEFAYKPSTPDRTVVWLPFHMPRLDWRMWFLFPKRWRSQDQAPEWFSAFCDKLLEGEPTVLSLLRPDSPFADGESPQELRVVYELYTYTTLKERRESASGTQYWKTTPPKTFYTRTKSQMLVRRMAERRWLAKHFPEVAGGGGSSGGQANGAPSGSTPHTGSD